MARDRFLIAVTGSLASGKSTVARLLAAQGYPVIDADQIAREAVCPGSPCLQKLAARFGPSILDTEGALRRAELRKLAFATPELRQEMESILHPEIARLSRAHFDAKFKQGHSCVIYEASLIFEAGRAKDFTGVLLVTAPEEASISRALARDSSMTEADARSILASQWSEDEKRKHASWTIRNDGSLEELRAKTLLWAQTVLPPPAPLPPLTSR